MTPRDLSVVIPTLNEAETIGGSVNSALLAGAGQVIIADGGSNDDTLAIAASVGATETVRSLPGRGIQLNAGSVFARGEFILFLHADNHLNSDSLNQICRAVESKPGLVWGAMRQRIDSEQAIYRLLEYGNAFRVRWRGLPFGDQAIFVRRSVYKRVGGFPEVQLMEDVELAQKLRKIQWPLLIPGHVIVSPRRWQAKGVLRQTIRNQFLQIAHAVGVSPDRLAKHYR